MATLRRTAEMLFLCHSDNVTQFGQRHGLSVFPASGAGCPFLFSGRVMFNASISTPSCFSCVILMSSNSILTYLDNTSSNSFCNVGR